MTRTQIRKLARLRLGETTAAFFETSDLNNWFNDAGRDIAFRTKCIRKSGYISTVEDEAEYTISTYFTNYLSIHEVYLKQDGSTWVRLTPTSREDLDTEHPGWKSASNGIPHKYWWNRDEDTLGLYVKPNATNAGTDYLQVYYADDFTEVDDDDASPSSLPTFLHIAIADFMVAFGLEQRGYGDKANDAWKKYLKRLHDFLSERKDEREDDNLIMKPVRNL